MPRRTLEEITAEARAKDPEAFDAAHDQAGRDLELGGRIRELRARAGLTQAQLAERVGTSRSAIARLELGGTTPSVETLERVARALGTRLRILFEEQAA